MSALFKGKKILPLTPVQEPKSSLEEAETSLAATELAPTEVALPAVPVTVRNFRDWIKYLDDVANNLLSRIDSLNKDGLGLDLPKFDPPIVDNVPTGVIGELLTQIITLSKKQEVLMQRLTKIEEFFGISHNDTPRP